MKKSYLLLLLVSLLAGHSGVAQLPPQIIPEMEFTDSGNVTKYDPQVQIDNADNFALLKDSTIVYVAKYKGNVRLTKVDLHGNILKRAVIGMDKPFIDLQSLLVVSPDGNIVVALYNASTAPSLNCYGPDLGLLWTKEFEGIRIADLLVLSSGKIIVGGEFLQHPGLQPRLSITVIYGFSATGDSLFRNSEGLPQGDSICQLVTLAQGPSNSFYAQTIFTTPAGGGYIRQLSADNGSVLGVTRIPGNLATGSYLTWLPQRQLYLLGTLPVNSVDFSTSYDLNVLDSNLQVLHVLSYPDANYLTRGVGQDLYSLPPLNLVRLTDDQHGGAYYTQKALLPNRNQLNYTPAYVRLGHLNGDGQSLWSVRDADGDVLKVFRVQQIIPLNGNEVAICGGYDFQPLVKIYRVRDNAFPSDSAGADTAAAAGATALAMKTVLRLAVFPNPASESVHFAWPEQMDVEAQVSIVDARTGATLRTVLLRKGATISMNVSGLLPGQYFLVLRGGSGQTASGGFIKL